jgi:prephenate dehydrogenase
VLWRHILRYNEKEIGAAIAEHRRLLDRVEQLLTAESPEDLGSFLARARDLREAIPRGAKDTLMGDHTIHVDLVDSPGGIAQVTGKLAQAGINIADIEILHVREGVPGVLKLGFYDEEAYRSARRLFEDKEENA